MRLYRKLIRPVHCYPGQGYEPKTEPVEKEEKWYPEEEREHLEKKYGYLNEGRFSDLIFEEKYEPFLMKEHDCRQTEYDSEMPCNKKGCDAQTRASCCGCQEQLEYERNKNGKGESMEDMAKVDKGGT